MELKACADAIGIRSANKLRKDELEKAIKCFLRTGTIRSPVKRTFSPRGRRDVDRELRPDLPVSIYTNDADTKRFLECESRKLAPGLKPKSGARYRLNRWREQQLTKDVRLECRATRKPCRPTEELTRGAVSETGAGFDHA